MATTAAIATAAAVEVGTGGTATPLLLALAGGMGGPAELQTNVMLRGHRMSREEVGMSLPLLASIVP